MGDADTSVLKKPNLPPLRATAAAHPAVSIQILIEITLSILYT